MKKLYSKFTKERGKAFQIETAIWEKEDGEREVTKRPLSAASRGHVAKMYENFRWFEESGFGAGLSMIFPGLTAFWCREF